MYSLRRDLDTVTIRDNGRTSRTRSTVGSARPAQRRPRYMRSSCRLFFFVSPVTSVQEIILDPNRFSGQVMFGVVDVSPDENILVYSVDTCGAEQYAPSLF